jgi:hypothetical protein
MKMSKAPMNQAERPLLVMKVAIIAEIITMVTAPGQNCRFIGGGPTGILVYCTDYRSGIRSKCQARNGPVM